MMIATAESCTGGMVAAALTDLPGSSSMFERGFVTYTNAAKQEMLGVTSQSLDQFGAVSEQVAHEMALGAQSRSHADLAVSLTGIAGPGGSDFKPEGRVCFGVAFLDDVHVSTVEFGAIGRTHVRRAATDHALMLMIEALS
ncbi:UNVERIFIED_CONTAM: hypothetical protein GTU68_055557 [Idotea baltica]|nr:hypothetical protein [Idotea baltica]